MIYHHWHVIGPAVIVAPRGVAPAAAGVPYFSVLKVATLVAMALGVACVLDHSTSYNVKMNMEGERNMLLHLYNLFTSLVSVLQVQVL